MPVAAAPPPPAAASASSDAEDADAAATLTKGKAGAKRKRATKVKAKVVEAEEPAAASLAAPVSVKRSHSKGYTDVARLADFYLGCLFGRLPGEPGGVVTVDDECDPRLVIRRLLDDLLELFDLPEWPIAELLLQRAAVMLVDRLSPRPAATGSVAAAAATLAVQLLGSILPRLQLSRCYALENPLRIPGPQTVRPVILGPLSTQEDAVCLCGRGPVTGSWMLDCDECVGREGLRRPWFCHPPPTTRTPLRDRCHRWFHGACVGLVVELKLTFWACDDCCMRKQVATQRVCTWSRCFFFLRVAHC